MAEIDRILDLLEPSSEIIKKGRERQEAIWEKRKPDYIPILLGHTREKSPGLTHERRLKLAEHHLIGGINVPEFDDFPHYNFKEQFYNKEQMLAEALWEIISWDRSRSDAQLAIRSNHGVGIVASIFGLEIEVREDSMPWVKNYLPKEKIVDFELPDIRKAGLIPRVIEHTEYLKEKLEGKARVYLPDTQGPFSIAHLVRGNDIFTDIYDDPDFVHHLMNLSTQAYIQVTKLFKTIVDEPLNSGYHGSLYMAGGGVRLCDDTSILLPPDKFREFSLPYLRRALEPFGGGWVHFCGDGKHLLDEYLNTEEVKAINLGNPEMYDYAETMAKLLKKDKFYYGSWPRLKTESVRDYFLRILEPLKEVKKGLIFRPTGKGDWPHPKESMEIWHSLQN